MAAPGVLLGAGAKGVSLTAAGGVGRGRRPLRVYADFAARFAKASLQSLIDSFNAQVCCRGWGSARACHDVALIDELKRRGIDLSAISQGGSTSFAHKVTLDSDGQKLVIAD